MLVDKPKIPLQLVGEDGNAMFIMGRFQGAARKEGWTQEEIDTVLDECMSDDYDHLLRTIMEHTFQPNSNREDEE